MLNSIEAFKTFLTEKNLYDEFIYNYDNQSEDEKEYSTVEEFFSKTDPYVFLLAAFTWTDTPEGGTHWSLLDDEWQEFLDIHEVIN